MTENKGQIETGANSWGLLPDCSNEERVSTPNLLNRKREKPNYCSGFTWGLDFCRALNERSWFCRLLFRLAVGKYAYMEFKGLWDETKKQGHMPDFSYDLEDIGYHTSGKIRGPDWRLLK